MRAQVNTERRVASVGDIARRALRQQGALTAAHAGVGRRMRTLGTDERPHPSFCLSACPPPPPTRLSIRLHLTCPSTQKSSLCPSVRSALSITLTTAAPAASDVAAAARSAARFADSGPCCLIANSRMFFFLW
jgi:hypothetical protein